jgi:hypothetical protein
MAITTLCLAAAGIIRDADTNVISAYNIIEQITAQSFPFLMPEMHVLCVWKKEDGEDNIQCQFRVTLNGNVLHDVPSTITFGNSYAYRSIIRLLGTVITGPGVLRFEFTIADRPAGIYEVLVITPPASAEVKS